MKIVLQDLTKIFPSRNKKSTDEVVAVDHFNFEIPDGKLIGLLGPSGCGKSTTLYMILSLIHIYEPRICGKHMLLSSTCFFLPFFQFLLLTSRTT